MKRLLEAPRAAHGTSWGLAKRIRSSPAPRARLHSRGEQEGRTRAWTASGSPSYTQGRGAGRALRALPFIQHLVLPARSQLAGEKSRKRTARTHTHTKMTQGSHQMGLDTRENATPVTYDTGDAGVTSTADPERGGDGRGAPALPTRPKIHHLHLAFPWNTPTPGAAARHPAFPAPKN